MKAIVLRNYGSHDHLCSPLISLFTNKTVRIVALKTNRDLDYDNMIKLFESGQLKPVIDGPYRLEEVPEAFRIFILTSQNNSTYSLQGGVTSFILA